MEEQQSASRKVYMTKIPDEKKSLFTIYAAEFEKNYLLEPSGQKHLAQYRNEDEELKRAWAEAKKRAQSGEKITDWVFEKLLPYSNTRHSGLPGCHV